MAMNFNDMPSRMSEIWEWVVAFDAFDFGDREPLANLLSTSETVPKEAARQLAKIVSGERKPNLKAAAKLRIPAAERMKIAGSISCVIGLANRIRTRGVHLTEDGTTRAVEAVADRKAKETVDITRELERLPTRQIEGAAAQLCVSVETIENLLRDLRKKIAAFPEI